MLHLSTERKGTSEESPAVKRLHDKATGHNASAPELLVVSRNNLQRWGTQALISLVVLQFAVSLMLPHLSGPSHIEISFLPHILMALIVLVLALSLRESAEHRSLRDVSKALIDSISYIENLEEYSFIDPETHTFNLSYLDHLFRQMSMTSNRTGNPTTLCLFEVRSDQMTAIGAAAIADAAAILRSNFRGSDYIVRYSAEQFLVLLPETNDEHAKIALNRLTEKVEYWNLESERESIMLRQEANTCPAGMDLWETLYAMKEKMEAEYVLRKRHVCMVQPLIQAGYMK
jgi:diguanylate cyclase (GGDEF)-like protein